MNDIVVKKYKLKKTEPKEKTYKIDYEKELNPAQFEAVWHKDNPLLIIAGAGSGKTRTLTYKVARLIEDGISPENILLLTFTRRAAKEMISRAEAVLSTGLKKIMGGTFHSFANMILRRYAQFADLKSNFTVIDRSDAEDVINHIRSQVLTKKDKRFPKKSTILDIYSKTINKDINIEQIIKNEFPQFEHCSEKIMKIAAMYNDYKKQRSLLDYDDLLLYLKALLMSNESIRNKISQKYKYILIDEYQDTNSIQAQIVRLLASTHNNVTAVGDDSQSIYSFRGANFKNILDFPKIYENCKIVTLEQNYRSSQNILDFANKILEKAKEKYSKTLFSTIESSEKPAIICCKDTKEEGEFVVQRILEFCNEDGMSLDDIAVLSRSASMMHDVETELIKQKIPYRKIGGLKFTETAHVKDITAYLRVVLNPKDEISWSRILHLQTGIGTAAISKLLPVLTSDIKAIPSALPLKPAQKEGTAGLLAVIDKAKEYTAEPKKAVEKILEFYEPILTEHYDDGEKRAKDLEHVLYLASKYSDLESFLSDMALEPPELSVTDTEEGAIKDECLTLSTIHGAKGTEYKAVFIIGAVDGKFPSLYSFNSSEELDEELRLFYVAVTRAKTYLFISYPTDMFDMATGMVLSKPSRFTDGISPDILER
ncbi:MAG: ATP-dependent helicase, partial [Candidatus Gastranaerophilales bacterium]|nr:ATP-dependent helicase [Candidatus Gastranaerophilales bacterium]